MRHKTLLILSSVVLSGHFLAADVYEGFDYPPGVLGTSAGGLGWMPDAGWGGFPNGSGLFLGVGGSSPLEVIADGLPAPVDYGLSGTGGALKGTTSYGVGFREMSVENRIDMDNGDPVYVSFLFSIPNIAATNGSYNLVTFLNADRTDLFRLGVTVGSVTANIAAGNNTSLAVGETITSDESYLYVAKITPGASEDILSASVYHSSEAIGSEPQAWEMEAIQDFPFAIIDRIGILPGGTESGQTDRRGTIDEIRIGSTFEAVTGVTEPAGSWAGYPWVNESGDVDTGTFLGWINAATDPWIWLYDLSGWAYADESTISEPGGWLYLPQ